MATDDPASRGFSLKRWSERKLAAARAASPPAAAVSASETPAAPVPTEPAPPITTPAPGKSAAAPALPSIENLTVDSDFSMFLGASVDPGIRLQALKKLFRDPRFNVMDGLDVYIDDYSIPDPLAPDIARSLAHARYILDPPRTRVNEAGIVEDVPSGEASIDARALPPETATMPAGVTTAAEATAPAEAASSRLSTAALNSGADSATEEAKPREESGPTRR